ncbi:palmitoyl-protein thioesterase [Gymnopilus junonius]|uniref:Palmitoyl-protein thioesterase 1 n=1 Tax=Gymnopilus junonius TaxID=109634 RepID=A0A9P5TQ99_GYMJU|nr:palmitoyl-protein thioesterase [Gymnopilus junonius]
MASLLLFFSLFLASALASVPRPLVIWHGLGDSHSSPGMLQFVSMVQKVHPGMFVHSVYIDEDLGKDRQAGFYGNVDQQVELVAAQLAEVPELEDGFDAIGFSQGGQFLRAYVERYNSPPVNNLITFGSQHMGISDIPACRRYDFLCQVAKRTAKQAVYGEWAQQNLVQAQYYRDPSNYKTYLVANKFLTDINNEVPTRRNETHARYLSTLKNLVLVMFTEDETVVPKESSWFGAEVIEEGMQFGQFPFRMVKRFFAGPEVIPMRLQPIYLEDWIGLKELDDRNGITFETCKGEHMQLGDCWEDLVIRFTGGED